MPTLLWIVIALLMGSIPFSLLLGKIFLRKDIRDFGDRAPGATNVARAGGRVLYIVAVLCDAFKGTVPVCLAQLISQVDGCGLAAVAVAPVLGHAFSPFLKFRGGMGVATTFGVWLGLTGWIGPFAIGAAIGIMFAIQKNWVWASVGGMLGLLIMLIILKFPAQFAVVCLAHSAILAGKRYTYFKSWPELQPWLIGRKGK